MDSSVVIDDNTSSTRRECPNKWSVSRPSKREQFQKNRPSMLKAMSDIKFVSWKEILLKTLGETDPEKLAQLVPEAELAMFKRQQQLSQSPQHSEELSAMPIASEALRVIKRRITKTVAPGSSTGNAARFANFVRRSGTA
jgi:hypothetical protein